MDGEGASSEKELTEFQVRWRYERVVLCLLDMVRHFHALTESAPDPELREAAGKAWKDIRQAVVGLRDRFGLAWVDSEEYGEEGEEELRPEVHRERLGKTGEHVYYLCNDCDFQTDSHDEAQAHYEETSHASYSKETVTQERIRMPRKEAHEVVS